MSVSFFFKAKMRIKYSNNESKETVEIDQIRLVLSVSYVQYFISIQSEISWAGSLAPIIKETGLVLKSRWKFVVPVSVSIVVILLSFVLYAHTAR